MNTHLTDTYFSSILSSSVVVFHVVAEAAAAAAMSKCIEVTISACFLFLAFLVVSISADTEIGITFWGDVRSRIEPWPRDQLEKACPKETDDHVGGIPSVVYGVKTLESDYFKNVNSKYRFVTGNLVSGETGYISAFDNGWEKFGGLLPNTNMGGNVSDFYNPDVMSLGIKELEAGPKTTVKYLKAVTSGKNPDRNTTIVLTTSNCTNDHDICVKENSLIRHFHIINDPSGVRIGVVGFVNPVANFIADAEPLKLAEDAADAIAKYLERPETPRTDYIIALGTGSYDIAKSILDRSPKVNLVIYGGGNRDMSGNFPQKYKDGQYIATTGAKCGTRIGALTITFGGDMKFKEIKGQIKKLDTPDADAVRIINTEFISAVNNSEVGSAVVNIDGTSCWEQECNLGNLVTDSMVHCAYNHPEASGVLRDNKREAISVWHGGAFYPDNVKAIDGKIKVLDVHTWLPYHNYAFLVKLRGSGLWKLLELGATALDNSAKKWGQFLQVSNGMEVTYDGGRLTRIRVAQHDGTMPRMKDVQNDGSTEYFVVIPSIIHKGKSVFADIQEHFLPVKGSETFIKLTWDDDCLSEYIKAMGVVTTGFEERIFFNGESGGSPTCNKKTGLTVFLTLFILGLIVGLVYAGWKYYVVPRRQNGNWCF